MTQQNSFPISSDTTNSTTVQSTSARSSDRNPCGSFAFMDGTVAPPPARRTILLNQGDARVARELGLGELRLHYHDRARKFYRERRFVTPEEQEQIIAERGRRVEAGLERDRKRKANHRAYLRKTGQIAPARPERTPERFAHQIARLTAQLVAQGWPESDAAARARAAYLPSEAEGYRGPSREPSMTRDEQRAFIAHAAEARNGSGDECGLLLGGSR